MRVEDCIVEVKRRSAGGCIDLGCVFQRTFARPVLVLLLVFAVPTLAASWLLLEWRDYSFGWSLMLWSVASALYSGALVSGIGPAVFGQPFSAGRSLRDLSLRFPLYLCWIAIIRLAWMVFAFCMFLPAALIVPWTAFLAEVVFLEQNPAGKVSRRMIALAGGGFYWFILGRFLLLMLLFVLQVLGLFLALNFLVSFLFNVPTGFERIDIENLGPVDALNAWLSEPFSGVLFLACLWLATPLTRIAWFFCYLDGRIRGECWDLEVAFQVEARRLEGGA